MQLDLAPMEGITNYIYRQTHHRHYGGITRYYTPFLTPNQNLKFNTREWNEISPAHNQGLDVIPQLLTANPDHFLWAARQLADLGYTQVNLNLGCPSGTVVAKNKGSGFLRNPDQLDDFFEKVFAHAPLEISVKTRIGLQDPKEFTALMQVFNRYPISCLTIHPRVRQQFYKGSVHLDVFADACRTSPLPLCYNGDLFTPQDVLSMADHFPDLHAIMLGRGVIANPALPLEVSGHGRRSLSALKDFHDDLYTQYKGVLYGDRSLLSRMKELWTYMLPLFTNSDRYQKPLRKALHCAEYETLIAHLFQSEALTDGGFVPPQ